MEADCGQNHIIITMDPVVPIKKQIAVRCEVARFRLSLSMSSQIYFRIWRPFAFQQPAFAPPNLT